MPIRIQCQCGKTLNVRDDLAGKTVKCPGCGQPIRVGGQAAPAKPSASMPATQTRPATQSRPAAQSRPAEASGPAASAGGLDDLFDEEGFSQQVAALCPACRHEMAHGAVLCTKCGYNKQTGQRLAAHQTAGVDIDHGTLALQKAKADMASADQMQRDMLTKSGMPWWALALVLFVMGSGLTIAVLVVNASRRVDENFQFNPLALFFMLAGTAFYLVGSGASILIIVHAFKQDTLKGVLCLFVPFYMLYHVCTNWKETWRYFVISVLMGAIGGGLYAAAAAQGGV